ncbi:hypothetical protein E4631_14450 [Hymenobacter sp. UV11]|uniref:hypothetical protein n=1 Tax=Hymenobacter sp. UV11 TaxID=1849735 RepID=UPI0010614E8E|nr:hypothetical protein [Hymenobacter sp. UV11]TDN39474.1 hypothetical protein A8B98_19765 [Hymenobacter sp. UV11]TFZ65433.1 hypothetical protein E4631_14450 [Hymenobacter sp. UV11]
METLQGYPYFPIEFTKDGQVSNPTQQAALLAGLRQAPPTDLLVLSHGWNNDMAEAKLLYDRLMAQFKQVLATPAGAALAGRTFAVLGVLWPSKKFADTNLIPSGAAGVGSPVTTALLAAALDRLHGTFDQPGADQALDAAKKLLPTLEDQPTAQAEFARLLRSVVSPVETSPDVDASHDFFALPGQQLLAYLGKPLPAALLPRPTPSGPAAGVGPYLNGQQAGLGQFFGGIKAGALNLLNYTTYYQMKERAGSVGSGGLRTVLQAVRKQLPKLRLHLAGHSFGGRVVTAAAAGPAGQPPLPVSSLTLLQAAFSHYGFSNSYDGTHAGFFRRVLTEGAVSGPILITHSAHDSAVGTMYPLASMLAHQVGAALGDAHDKYGGMGRNGAQKTPEATEEPMGAVGSPYVFAKGRVFNLNADAIIQDHSDICHPEVAYAWQQAIALP